MGVKRGRRIEIPQAKNAASTVGEALINSAKCRVTVRKQMCAARMHRFTGLEDDERIEDRLGMAGLAATIFRPRRN
jgi:hypothetical protein